MNLQVVKTTNFVFRHATTVIKVPHGLGFPYCSWMKCVWELPSIVLRSRSNHDEKMEEVTVKRKVGKKVATKQRNNLKRKEKNKILYKKYGTLESTFFSLNFMKLLEW